MVRKTKRSKRVRFSKLKGGKNRTHRNKKRSRVSKSILLNKAKMGELDLEVMPKLDKETVIMGIIYAKWCPHCKDLIPDENNKEAPPKWQQTMDIIQEMPGRDRDMYHIKLEEEDINQHGKLDTFNKKCEGICETPITVNGYPTIFRINGGKLDIYDGSRDPPIMAEWFTNTNTHSS